MASLEQAVHDKVGAAIGELMPPEEWAALIKRAFSSFTERELDYQRQPEPSRLDIMARVAIEKTFAEALTKTLASPEWNTEIEGLVSERVTTLVAEQGVAIMQAFLTQTIQSVIAQALSGTATQPTFSRQVR